MQTIDRRNILELIGKHRGKYHSCILTCYNFDFSFFEERVLPVFRTANIKNVNVLADGIYLEQAQEMTTGKEFQHNKTYNFLPVYERGVFHPKIMMLTGLKHGLLIIGSGNITSSGLSTNDEIWGAFHLDTSENENAALFAEAWKYLETFTTINYGFLPQKIEWIKKYSPWLDALPQTKGSIELNSLNQNIQFLSNSPNQSIYQQLVASVSSENLKILTVVSPYFDKSGGLLKQLLDDFNPATFNCIVDTNSGLLPTDFSQEERNRIDFYDWQHCMEDYTSEVNRLHAKIFLFSYSDGSEKMLLGSANASLAGMGSLTGQAANAEAGILISRKQSGNWLKELRIKLTETAINISRYSNISGLFSSAQQKSNYPLRILYSELKGSEITCYLNKVADKTVSMVVLSRNGIITETVGVSLVEKAATGKVSDINAVFKVYLVNAEGERVSNHSITHRLEMLLRCNPDPTQEKFDALLEQDFPNGDGVTVLLEFVDYNWVDDDTESPLDYKRISGGRKLKGKDEKEEKKYQTLSKEEFNKVNAEILMKQSGLLTSANVKLADFLNLVLSGESHKEADYNESEEQKLLEDEEQKGEGADVQTKSKPKAIALKEKRALVKYFGKLDNLYTNKLDKVYEAKALTVTPDEPITIKSISKMLIALQLVHIYHGKKFITQLDEKEESSLKEEKYLLDGNLNDKYDTIKGFVVNVLGKFLLLSTAGINSYDYDILNEKMRHYRQQVFEKALFLILNWKTDEELKYRLTLLLNLHYYIEPNEIIDDEWLKKTKGRIEDHIKTSKYNSTYLDDNSEYYFKKFLIKYELWLNLFKGPDKQLLIKDTSSVSKGDVIFNSKMGFNHIHNIVSQNPFIFDLKRDGYVFTDSGYILEKITYGNKYINYS
ncbi:hypothetical protein EF405_18875 [Cyclobacteriaceae bacterium YHN15]|nr:hypothetical protein EF405_18875 [Cyclobacteriaceae bacterium YHN15]